MASAKQKCISRIWAYAKNNAVSEENLYLLVKSVTNSDSISKLNIPQLVAVIEKLEGKKKPNRSAWGHSNISFFPSKWQKEKVTILLKSIKVQNPEAYLESISMRCNGKEYSKLNGKELGKVIEALKSIAQRSENAN